MPVTTECRPPTGADERTNPHLFGSNALSAAVSGCG
jgi:hypothetical protein